jgi:cyclase
VINSHAHADHYQGNAVFSDDAILIASTKTRNAIADEGLFRLKRMKNSMMEQTNDLRKKLEQSITLQGTRRKAELITFGGAHSPCDAVLWLPRDEILFSADLIIPNDNLILSQGHPENWMPIIEQLENLRPNTIIPGHGRVVPATDGFAWARYYLNYLSDLVNEFNASKAIMDIEDLTVPTGCRKNWFVQNVRFLLYKSNTPDNKSPASV